MWRQCTPALWDGIGLILLAGHKQWCRPLDVLCQSILRRSVQSRSKVDAEVLIQTREMPANRRWASAQQKSQCQSFFCCNIDPNSLLFISHLFFKAASSNSSSTNTASKASEPCDNNNHPCVCVWVRACVYVRVGCDDYYYGYYYICWVCMHGTEYSSFDRSFRFLILCLLM